VLVVGSGCSGLTTAIVAAKHGLSVLVVEKTKYFGGTTAFSGGGAWIPNNPHQPSIGVEDSTAQGDVYLRKVLGDLYDPKKIPIFLQSGPEMVSWMEEHSAVRFKPVPLPDYHVSKAGASVGRTLLTEEFDGRQLGALIKNVRYPLQGYSAFGSMQADPAELSILTNPFASAGNLIYATKKVFRYAVDLALWGKGTALANGNALVGRLLFSAQQQGIQMMNNTPAIKTIIDQGRVAGLQVLSDGKEKYIHARKGVVLASGGFGRSEEAKQFVPHEWCAAPQGNTGDGKRMGVESGGALPPKNPMNAIFAPISLLNVPNGPVRRFPHFAIDRSKPGSIIVGPDGKRFANESESYQEFVGNMHQKGIQKAYYIADRTHLRKYGMGMALPWPYPIGNLLRQGYLISAPTISALANKIGVPLQNLEQTVSKYNSFASTGKDLEYNRGANAYDQFYGDPAVKPNPNLRPCEKGPFYALPLYPGNVSTLYGLITNTDAQVVDKKGQVIEGLYAVGCDQNSVFKGAYPGGGSSIGPGMTFGYRAGLKLAGIRS
jgi:succinate dehydrogenase/fumarate reductase flavoprotein subunit